MDRLITVKGKGTASVPPDLIVLSFTLTALKYKYSQTMDEASKMSNLLLEMVAAVGFEKEDLKTSSFEIDAKYESYQDKNKDYKSRFVGYQYEQRMRLEFEMDFEKLAKVMNAVSESLIEPKISIYFTIKDHSAVTDMVLRNATEDALRKAKIMSEAAGAKLGNLVSINYNWSEVEFRSYTDLRMAEAEQSVAYSSIESPHILPEDIEVDDTVTFVWELL